MSRRNPLLVALLLTLHPLGAGRAQTAPGAPPAAPPINEHEPMGRAVTPPPVRYISTPLERYLTPAQRVQLQLALRARQETIRALQEKLQAARREMTAAQLAAQFDAAALRAKTLAVYNLEAEIAILNGEAFATLRPTLTAAQLAQMTNPPAAIRSPAATPSRGPRVRGQF